MAVDLSVFRKWVVEAQAYGQLDQTVTLKTTSEGEAQGLVAGGLKTISLAYADSEMKKVKELELTPEEKARNASVRKAFYDALTIGGFEVADEIRDFLVGERNKFGDLTGQDLRVVFRALKDRTIEDVRTGMVAANNLAKAGLENELLKELADAGFPEDENENGELSDDEVRLSPLNDALSKIIQALTEAKRPPSLEILFNKGDLMNAFWDIHEMQNGKSNYLLGGVERAEGALRRCIETFSNASVQLGEAINWLSDKVDDTVRNALFILQEKTELYAIRLENVIEELKADSNTASSKGALVKALKGEFGSSGLDSVEEQKLEDELADVNRCISELDRFTEKKEQDSLDETKDETKKEWNDDTRNEFLARARGKVDALASHLQSLSEKENHVFDSVRAREILRQVVAVKSSLDKYGENIAKVKDESFLAEDGSERSFGSLAALREAFCGHLDVSAYVELSKDYPMEMIEFFVGDDNVASTHVFGGSVNNDGAVFGHRIASGKGPAKFVAKNLENANSSAGSAPYSVSGIKSSQDMARTNYACFKAGQVVLGTQSNVKAKVSIVSSGKNKGKRSILMEQAKGKSVYGLYDFLCESSENRSKHFDKSKDKLTTYWRGIGSLLKSANELDWSDWLIAQGDRHFNNAMVDVDDMNTFTFKGIDNDLSLPANRPSLDKIVMKTDKEGYEKLISRMYASFNDVKGDIRGQDQAFKDMGVDQFLQKNSKTDKYELLPFDEKAGEVTIDLACFEAVGKMDKKTARLHRELLFTLLGMNNLRRPHYITSGQLAKLKERAAELDEWDRELDRIKSLSAEKRQQALEEFAEKNPQSIYAQFKDILTDEGQIAGLYSRTREMLEHARKLETDGFVLDESLLTEENLAKAAAGKDSHLSDFYNKLRTRITEDMREMSFSEYEGDAELAQYWGDLQCHVDTAVSLICFDVQDKGK